PIFISVGDRRGIVRGGKGHGRSLLRPLPRVARLAAARLGPACARRRRGRGHLERQASGGAFFRVVSGHNRTNSAPAFNTGSERFYREGSRSCRLREPPPTLR